MTPPPEGPAPLRGYALAASVGVVLLLVVFRAVLWHPDSTVLLQAGDATSAARDYWAMAEQGRSPFTFVRDAYLNAPEGQERAPAVQIANAVEPLFMWTLGPIVGYLAAVNLFWVLGLVASVLATTALFRRLRLHPLAAFAGTVGFVFSQWEFEQLLYGHVAFAHLWVFPTVTLALLWAQSSSSSWAAAVPGALTAVSFYVSSYFGLFVLAMAAVFAVAGFRVHRVALRVIARRLAVGAGAFVGVLLPATLAPWIAPSRELGLPSIPRSSLHGADLSNYLIPSAHNALYGHVLGVANGRVGDDVLFPGVVLAALGLLGAWRVMSSRGEPQSSLVPRFGFWLLPVALLMSMPAYLDIGPRAIPLPNAAYAIGGVVQWWRSYTRFGMLVVFALALLAGFALDALLRSGRGRLKLLAVLSVAAIALEALPFAAVPTKRVTETPASRWIAANGDGGIVAIYPMAVAPDPDRIGIWDDHVWSSLFLQTRHGHRLYSLPVIRLRPTRADALRILTSDLGRSDTAPLLKGLGVRHVVSNDAVYRSLGRRPPADRQAGLDLVARLPDARIFRVVARAESAQSALDRRKVELARAYAHGSPTIRFGSGFHTEELYQGAPARWLRQDGIVHVRQSLARSFVTHRLSFLGFANAFPRRLQIWNGNQLLTTFGVGMAETRHSVRIRLPETVTRLRLRASPGPSRFGDGTIDLRRASVYVARLSVEPVDVDLES